MFKPVATAPIPSTDSPAAIPEKSTVITVGWHTGGVPVTVGDGVIVGEGVVEAVAVPLGVVVVEVGVSVGGSFSTTSIITS
jgi:hypothetical protein